MQTIGVIIQRTDVESDLADFLKLFPEDRLLNLESVMHHINSGSGGFSDVEGILLLLESIVRSGNGESGW